MDNLPSKLIEKAVDQVNSLPGIGRRTALRLVLHLLKRSETEVVDFTESISKLKQNIKICRSCCNYSDTVVCGICQNPNRDETLICVVENVQDVMAIESTAHYKGVYHVLGGVISPMEGIGPANLNIAQLIERCQKTPPTEVIFALPASMEGETTNFFLHKKLAPMNVQTSVLARGLGIGDDIQFADEVTLVRSINNRTPFENSLNK